MTISPTLKQFLDLIGFSEGADYDTIVSGPSGPETFTDYSDHPFAHRAPKVVRKATSEKPALVSTASGKYQILYRIWSAYRQQLGLKDFSPVSQDAVAAQLVTERHAVPMLMSGDIAGAIKACSNIWASLPGNNYGQGGHSLDELLAKWDELSSNSMEAV